MEVLEGCVNTKVTRRLDNRIKSIRSREIEFPNDKWARIYYEKFFKKRRTKPKAFEPY